MNKEQVWGSSLVDIQLPHAGFGQAQQVREEGREWVHLFSNPETFEESDVHQRYTCNTTLRRPRLVRCRP